MSSTEIMADHNGQGSEKGSGLQELKVGIVGCGNMGRRRAQIVNDAPDEILCVVADIDKKASRDLAEKMDCQFVTDWEAVVNNDQLDIIIVSVPNKYMSTVAIAALGAGKHVLCEKPLGRNRAEAEQMVEASERAEGVFQIGFNKRFHPAAMKMRALFDEGVLGPVMFSRATFGHGAKVGMEKAWFGSADLAGGGALIDIGVHLVDLIRWFHGDFKDVYAVAGTYFWDLGRFEDGKQMDDNAFFLMRTPQGQVAQVHASWTYWKNQFSFEIFGRNGFLRWEGLGGYYGPASVTQAKRRPESGPPIIQKYEFEGGDNSLQLEWDQFMATVRGERQEKTNVRDALETMRVIEALYESAHTASVVSL